MELKQYGLMIRKRWWLIALCVLLTTTITGIYSYMFIKPVYQASTKLIVNEAKQNNPLVALDLNAVNVNLKLIDTYKEIIRTPAIMDKVAVQYPDLNLTAEQLTGKVKVSSVNNTQVMTLAVQDPSYSRAVDIVNAVSQVFKQEIPNIMKVDNVSILNVAESKEHAHPVAPNKLLNIIIGFIVSLMATVGIVFLLDYLDDTIKSEQDVSEVLGLTTLTVIAKIKKDDTESKHGYTTKRKVGDAAYATVNQ